MEGREDVGPICAIYSLDLDKTHKVAVMSSLGLKKSDVTSFYFVL